MIQTRLDVSKDSFAGLLKTESLSNTSRDLVGMNRSLRFDYC